jgi:hypothetical protein
MVPVVVKDGVVYEVAVAPVMFNHGPVEELAFCH